MLPVQLSIVSVNAPGVNDAKVKTPTVPVPKSSLEPVAVRVRAPSPGALALPSEKFPLAKVPPASVIVAVLLDRLLSPRRNAPPALKAAIVVYAGARPGPTAPRNLAPLPRVAPLSPLARG